MGTQTILFYEIVADTKEETVISIINDGELFETASNFCGLMCILIQVDFNARVLVTDIRPE